MAVMAVATVCEPACFAGDSNVNVYTLQWDNEWLMLRVQAGGNKKVE